MNNQNPHGITGNNQISRKWKGKGQNITFMLDIETVGNGDQSKNETGGGGSHC